MADIHTLDDLIKKLESNGYSSKKEGHKGNRVVLEEKYFRRMDKFDGDLGNFRAWIFDLEVTLGSIDSELDKTVGALVREHIPDPSEANMDQALDQETQDTYST